MVQDDTMVMYISLQSQESQGVDGEVLRIKKSGVIVDGEVLRIKKSSCSVTTPCDVDWVCCGGVGVFK